MRKVVIEGKLCIGPTFTDAEFALIKKNVADQEGLETLAELMNLVGNAHRLKIIYLLHAHKEMSVCDIAEVLQISAAAVSQHLGKLKARNLVKNRRQGLAILYSLQDNVFVQRVRQMFHMQEAKQQHAFLLNE